MKRAVGHLETFVSVLFFALNIPAVKFLFNGWLTPQQILLYRILFAVAAFWFISLWIKTGIVSAQDKLLLLGAGVLGLFGMQYLYMEGLDLTSPIDASIILTIPPVLVLLYSVLFNKEKVTLLNIAGILLALSGALLVILTQAHKEVAASLKGNIFILCSSVCWAAYLLFTKKVSQKYDGVTVMKWTFLAAALPAIFFCVPSVFHQGLALHRFTIEPATVLTFVLVFPTIISFLLIPLSMKHISATTVSMYSYLIPIIASVVAIFAGQATLRWDQPVALVLLIGGMFLTTRKKRE